MSPELENAQEAYKRLAEAARRGDANNYAKALRAVRAALHGAMPEKWANVSDANLWRKLPYAVLIASLLVFGFFPRLLTDKVKPVTAQIVSMATGKPVIHAGRQCASAVASLCKRQLQDRA